jgi:hypothetical protein
MLGPRAFRQRHASSSEACLGPSSLAQLQLKQLHTVKQRNRGIACPSWSPLAQWDTQVEETADAAPALDVDAMSFEDRMAWEVSGRA